MKPPFVDGGSQREFEVPANFRAVVEPRGQLPQKDSEQNISFGAPESAEPSATTALSESKHGKPSTIDAADSPEPTEIRKRAALIAEVIGFWPSIGLDLSDSSRNGLSKCAKYDKHGFWVVEHALVWATQRGRIVKTKAQSFLTEKDDSRLSPMLRKLLKLN